MQLKFLENFNIHFRKYIQIIENDINLICVLYIYKYIYTDY